MQRKNLPTKEDMPHYEDSIENAGITNDVVEIGGDVSSGPNYSSDEFNRLDELDDNVGNYRNFEPLTGIVTSDMRFHEKRKRWKAEEAEAGAEPSVGSTPENIVIKSVSEDVKDPQPLTIVSEGRVLIIDTDLEKSSKIAEFLKGKGMRCLLCVIDAESCGIAPSQLNAFPLVKVPELSVSGAFGGFTAAIAGMDTKPAELSGLAGRLSGLTGHNGRYYDLVLDLQDIPSYAGNLLPLGYYAPAGSADLLETALQDIPELQGRFEKPQFIGLRKDRCLHGRHRLLECRQCVDICPVSAIEEQEQNLVVNHYICQGCGGCSLVCPAEAIKSFNPPQREVRSDLFRQLQEQRRKAENGAKKDAVLYDHCFEKSAILRTSAKEEDDLIFLEVDDLGRMGVAEMLMVLAGGAGSLLMVCDRKWSAPLRHALERQVELGRTILSGLQFSPDLLSLVTPDLDSTDVQEMNLFSNDSPRLANSIFPLQINFHSSFTDREIVQLTAGYLAQAQGLDNTAVELPMGAPFGTVDVSEKCSFCMACVGACPAEALAAGGDEPRLLFMEKRCHQCGLCVLVCPENAIHLQPRLLCTTEQHTSAALLKDTKAAECIECGKPFASKVMIDRMREKLSGHWMFGSDRQLRRLQMCAVCRTRDALLERGYNDENP